MKKVLSAVLALVMVLSMIPMAALAAGYPVCIEDSAIRDFYNYAFASSNTYNFPVDENGKEDYTAPNLQTGYGSFTVKRGTPAYDFGCYRIKYQSTVYQPQEYKNIKIEYSNPGVVEVDTSGISSGYMELKFNYVGEGTTDITITYTVGKCGRMNNGPGYSEIYMNKTAKLVYNDVKSVYVPVDEDGDGFDDLDGTCLHEKNDEGYCTVEGCEHPDECCPKKSNDGDGDGFDDLDGTCLHEKDGEGYCTVEGCEHPDECCPKKSEIKAPADPTAEKIWETAYSGFYVFVDCEKNSSHTAKIAVKNHNDGLIFGKVLPNDGSDKDFPVDRYPWMCEVTPDAEYFVKLAVDNYDLNQVKRWNFNHTITGVKGQTFYGDETCTYWYFSDSWGLYIDVTH